MYLVVLQLYGGGVSNDGGTFTMNAGTIRNHNIANVGWR